MAALMTWWENIKKYKHGNHCNDQRKRFSPFVVSVYGILGGEEMVVLLQLSQVMAEKRDELLSHVWGWVNSQILIAVTRLYSRMIRGAQLFSIL